MNFVKSAFNLRNGGIYIALGVSLLCGGLYALVMASASNPSRSLHATGEWLDRHPDESQQLRITLTNQGLQPVQIVGVGAQLCNDKFCTTVQRIPTETKLNAHESYSFDLNYLPHDCDQLPTDGTLCRIFVSTGMKLQEVDVPTLILSPKSVQSNNVLSRFTNPASK